MQSWAHFLLRAGRVTVLMGDPRGFAWAHASGPLFCEPRACGVSTWPLDDPGCTIEVDRRRVLPDGEVVVSMDCKLTQPHELAGMLLMAVYDNPRSVLPCGEFIRGKNFLWDSPTWRHGPCGSNSLTQFDDSPKPLPFTFVWRAPSDFSGKVYFVGAFVKSYTYWTRATSLSVKLLENDAEIIDDVEQSNSSSFLEFTQWLFILLAMVSVWSM